MRWATPEYGVGLLLIPLLLGFWFWAFRNRRRLLEQFAAANLLKQLTDSVDWTRKKLKAGLLTGALALLVLALMGPQWGFHWQEVKRQGIELVIAVDVSKSMLVEDVRPNRLERAKLAIEDLLGLLRGDQIGLIAFSGTAFVQCPLTIDYGAFSLALDDLEIGTIPRGGTALAPAIREGLRLFSDGPAQSQALILITDGEDHEGDVLKVVKEASQRGIKIFTVGIGTSKGELIPILDEQGRRTFLKDRAGRTIKSRLDEALLRDIAIKTGGSYVRATATSFGLDLIYQERLAKMKPQEFENAMRKQYEFRFQWVLAVAFLLLCLELVLGERKRRSVE